MFRTKVAGSSPQPQRNKSRQRDVWNQSEGEYTPARDAIRLTAITYSPAVRLHANPSDWIEKRPFENGLFSWARSIKMQLYKYFDYTLISHSILFTRSINL